MKSVVTFLVSVIASTVWSGMADDLEQTLNLTSGIKGRIYIDKNNNDVLDQEDTFLRDAEISVIEVSDKEAAIVKAGASDGTGNFKIVGLRSGFYRLRVTSKVAEPFVTDQFEIVGGEEGVEFNIKVGGKSSELFHFKDRTVNPQNIEADEVSVSAP